MVSLVQTLAKIIKLYTSVQEICERLIQLFSTEQEHDTCDEKDKTGCCCRGFHGCRVARCSFLGILFRCACSCLYNTYNIYSVAN